jgi:hypothetical protein
MPSTAADVMHASTTDGRAGDRRGRERSVAARGLVLPRDEDSAMSTQFSCQTPSCQWFQDSSLQEQERPHCGLVAKPSAFCQPTSGNHWQLGVWELRCPLTPILSSLCAGSATRRRRDRRSRPTTDPTSLDLCGHMALSGPASPPSSPHVRRQFRSSRIRTRDYRRGTGSTHTGMLEPTHATRTG